jgi:hypothetical protein
VVLMIVAAVALPVMLHQRDAAVAKATTLSQADQVGGLTRSTDLRMQQDIAPMTAVLSRCGCFQPPVTSGYVVPDRTHLLVVLGAKFSGPPATRPARISSVVSGATGRPTWRR